MVDRLDEFVRKVNREGGVFYCKNCDRFLITPLQYETCVNNNHHVIYVKGENLKEEEVD